MAAKTRYRTIGMNEVKNMKVPLGHIEITEKQKKIINEILDSGRITEGPWVRKFEKLVEEFIGVKHAIAVTNGTVALELVGHYLSRKYGRGLNVCVPATTFPATLNAFYNCGHNIILCDIKEDLTIDIDSLGDDVLEKIDVIVPVSLLGYSPDMEYINQMAKIHKWVVVEDFAEAFGSVYTPTGERLGSIGDFGTSSFYVSHVVKGGELGVVTTNDDEAAEIMRSMKNHGRTGSNLEFLHGYIGSNYKTTEFCAGIASSQLEDVKAILAKRWKTVNAFYKGLYNPRLTPYQNTPACSYLGCPFIADTEKYKKAMCEYLNKHGIETRGMFPNLANQTAYRGLDFTEGDYPVSNDVEKRAFYIGCHQYLTQEQIEHVIKALNEEL